MSMRLQEIHPALVHYPIALLPLSVVSDLLGRVTGSEALMDTGRRTMPLGAASAIASGVFGFVAQESVEAEGEAHAALVTHRTVNLGLVLLATCMAGKRMRQERPSWRYLAAGLAGLSAMGYGAYLGGKMVYTHGVGVEAAGGVNEEAATEVVPGKIAEVARESARHLVEGIRHALQHTMRGELVPALRGGEGRGPDAQV